MRRNTLGFLASFGLVLGLMPARSSADEIPEKYRETVRKGLDWIAKQQHKDGHWGGNSDQAPVAMTGMAAMALLMEGSTIREGKYANHIRRAADWLMARSMRGGGRDGMVGNPDHPQEAGRYMYGHGFGTLFLASVYGDEDDKDRRERLKDILTRAVKYTGNAQSRHPYPKDQRLEIGGWFYTSAAEGGNNDEGSVTITQVQALRACRNGGIAVPKEILGKAKRYLEMCTTPNGGVVYQYGRGMRAPAGGERPPLTAAAIACLFNAGEYKDELCKKWFKYCQRAIPIGAGRQGHDEYTHYYYAQAVYTLGDDGWEKLFGPTPADQRVTWSAYRAAMFDHLMRTQSGDGSWQGGGSWGVGPVYTSSIFCTIMQLDKGTLPIYQR